jgi:Secretion system C-terminal sorting domain
VKAQPDGKLVVCGTGNSGYLIILRYENDLNTSGTSMAQETGLVVWPNPADDHLRLNTTITGAARVEILDATGRVVRSMRTMNSNGLLIPVADLTPGQYVLRCSDDSTVHVLSFHVVR